MAFIQCNLFSEALEMSCAVNVLLPQRTAAQVGMQGRSGDGRHPTLWLLHGRTDDHTIWMRRTSIERYASELGLAVVMPNVHLSWYQDTLGGPRYFEYISEELPRLCRDFFPLSDRREDNFIAGLSMGGYGAWLHALRNPQNFAAAASLSGALDLADLVTTRKTEQPNAYAALAPYFPAPDAIAGTGADLFALARQVCESKADLPALYACCGTEDFLYEGNQRFLRHADEIGLPVTYEEGPGEHNWAFWDQWIQRVLAWLPLEKPIN
ncbi:esterase family protein [Ruficoccus amylovorans]|uniref:Esterase family protein n=1 Tax=Ruficoccus amylovorans TaxID=1804625 RepID=A0A842HGP7_9BACT|nr:alpha/beta hydrolase family protein [Ruficoccus amylovorans]MBC2594796.1 esterase family protein [Ruficoccus amylovorans]